jgi:acyl carrier protein
MTDDEIRERVVRIYTSVSAGGRPPAEGGKGELDSMAFLQFIAGLEAEFDFIVDVRDINENNFKTTEQTTQYLRRTLKPRTPG